MYLCGVHLWGMDASVPHLICEKAGGYMLPVFFCVTKMSRRAACGRKCHKKNHLKTIKISYFGEHRKSPENRRNKRETGHFLTIGMTGFEPAASCSQSINPIGRNPHGCAIFRANVSRSCDEQNRVKEATLRQRCVLWRRVRLPVLPVYENRPVWSYFRHAP